jgi:superfamily II DNA or RNA helicase
MPIKYTRFTNSVADYLPNHALKEIIARGKQYFKSGMVLGNSFQQVKDEVTLKVDGTSRYTTKLFLSKTNPFEISKTTCTCPYNMGGICKHRVAVLIWCEKNELEIDFKFKGKKQIAKKRDSSTPFVIKNFADLTSSNFLQKYHNRYIGQSEYELHGFTINEPKTNQFSIPVSFEHSYYSNDSQNETLLIEVTKSDLEISCSCKTRVQNLCFHAYEFIDEMLEEDALKNFTAPSKAELQRTGEQLMNDFGFDTAKNWEDFFMVQFSGKNRILLPKPAFKSVISPAIFDTLEVDKIHKTDAEVELKELSEIQPNYLFNLGFSLGFNKETDQTLLTPFIGKTNAKGEKMSIGFKEYNHYNKRDVLISLLDYPILNAQEPISYARNDATIIQKFTEISSSLEQHPYLFINTNRQLNSIYKGGLKPIKYRGTAPETCYELIEKNGFITMNIFVVHNQTKISTTSNLFEILNSHFVKVDDTIYFISAYQEAAHLNLSEHLDGKQFAVSKFPDTFEKYLRSAFTKYKVDTTQLKSYLRNTVQLVGTEKQMYLSEVDGFVLLRPFLIHESGELLNVLAEYSNWDLNNNKLIERRIDENIAQEYKEILQELHPDFKRQLELDYLHISYEKLTSNNHFSSLFRQLQENNVKVFGLKNLTGLKVNPFPGKVSYTVKSNTDWFDVEASITFGDSTINTEDLKKRFSPGSEYIELSDGTKGVIPEEWLAKLEKLFRHGEVKDGKLTVSKKMFSLVDELFEQLEDEETIAFIEEKKEKLLNFNGLKSYSLPRGVKAKLRHYQEDGFQWLCFLDEFNWGGILADDMGLGKTLQILTFLKHLKTKNKTTNLVVVPTSLLFNWQNEIEKFTPSLKAHFYYGPQREKDTAIFDKYDLVITTYGHMLSDIVILKDYAFNYAILDESQAIKNPTSKRFKAARLLQANNRIAMTGTPIENNTFDLFAQLSFLNPGFLGSAAGFKKDFAKAIDSERNQEKAADLQRLIKPFVLRRTKEQVATELPDKTEEILYCEMDKPQRKIYDAYRNKYRSQLTEKIEADGLNKSRFTVLEGLTKLRQICDSPHILPGDEKYNGESVKIDLLVEHIKEKTGNHKILIFSQFVKMLKQIESKISAEGISYEYLDGKSNSKQRKASVENFQTNEDCRVFLISLKAGGTGLNLMAADYVYIVDPWWNPAVENQAIDRCYRIGQKKNVIAYRLICKNTIEEKIVELQQKKKSVAGDIVTTDENVLKKLDKDDLIGLFS